MSNQDVYGWALNPSEESELRSIAARFKVTPADATILFNAVAVAGGYETCAWDILPGVEAVLSAGWRPALPPATRDVRQHPG